MKEITSFATKAEAPAASLPGCKDLLGSDYTKNGLLYEAVLKYDLYNRASPNLDPKLDQKLKEIDIGTCRLRDECSHDSNCKEQLFLAFESSGLKRASFLGSKLDKKILKNIDEGKVDVAASNGIVKDIIEGAGLTLFPAVIEANKIGVVCSNLEKAYINKFKKNPVIPAQPLLNPKNGTYTVDSKVFDMKLKKYVVESLPTIKDGNTGTHQ